MQGVGSTVNKESGQEAEPYWAVASGAVEFPVAAWQMLN